MYWYNKCNKYENIKIQENLCALMSQSKVNKAVCPVVVMYCCYACHAF